MESKLLREWKNKLTPKLSHLRPIRGIGLGQFGLVINLAHEDATSRLAIDQVFEAECPDVPYVVKIVDKTKKMHGS